MKTKIKILTFSRQTGICEASKNKKLKIIVFFVICSLFFVTCPVFAANNAPTKIVSPTSTPSDVRNDVKERVQERIQVIKQKAFQRAFWGTLKQRMDTTLIINGPDGEKRIKTSTETTFINSAKKEIKIGDIEIDNFMITLGYWQDNGTLDAKRIIVLSKAPQPVAKRYVVHGLVSKIDKSKKIIEITDIKTKVITDIQYATTTKLTKKVDDKMQTATIDNLRIGDRVVTVGTMKTTGPNLIAKIIHVIPSTTALPTTIPTAKPTKALKVSPTSTQE